MPLPSDALRDAAHDAEGFFTHEVNGISLPWTAWDWWTYAGVLTGIVLLAFLVICARAWREERRARRHEVCKEPECPHES